MKYVREQYFVMHQAISALAEHPSFTMDHYLKRGIKNIRRQMKDKKEQIRVNSHLEPHIYDLSQLGTTFKRRYESGRVNRPYSGNFIMERPLMPREII